MSIVDRLRLTISCGQTKYFLSFFYVDFFECMVMVVFERADMFHGNKLYERLNIEC